MALSSLCVLHCIALPLLLIFLPAASSLAAMEDELFHLILVFFAAPISLFAVLLAYRHHRQLKIVLFNIVGVTLLISALLFGHDLFAGKGEVFLTLIGSFLIVYSHIINLRARREKECNTHVDPFL
jgi:predicted membrane protein